MTESANPMPQLPPQAHRGWIKTALDRNTVRRTVAYALVVGTILIATNHGDAVLTGNVSPTELPRMGLTDMVPYTVSTCSSVGAIRHAERTRRR